MTGDNWFYLIAYATVWSFLLFDIVGTESFVALMFILTIVIVIRTGEAK